MRVPRVHVHMAEQVSFHIVAIRIRVAREQPDVFVEVERAAQGKIQFLGLMQAHEVAINTFHRAAGGEAEDEMRIGAQIVRHDARHERRGGLLVWLYDDFHRRDSTTS